MYVNPTPIDARAKPDFFLRRIREEFPEIRWKSCRYLTHGWDHIVVILDENMVFRAPKDLRYKNELENETQLLHYLRKKVKVGIPDYSYISRDRSFAGYKMLIGQELTVPLFQRLNTSEKEIVAKQLSEFITALHSTPKSAIGNSTSNHTISKNSMRSLFATHRKFLFPDFPKATFSLLSNILTN